jgi:NADP-dependent 3-hydroxy acid dehydrogenase YdfG
MKIAVITGASSGMGREFVTQLDRDEQFDEVWLIARRAERLQAMAVDYPIPVTALSMDLTDETAYAELEGRLTEEKPTVRLLC